MPLASWELFVFLLIAPLRGTQVQAVIHFDCWNEMRSLIALVFVLMPSYLPSNTLDVA